MAKINNKNKLLSDIKQKDQAIDLLRLILKQIYKFQENKEKIKEGENLENLEKQIF